MSDEERTESPNRNLQEIAIPDKYKVFGASTGFLPAHADELRLIVEGFAGEGKTTFVSSDPKSFILDFDLASGNVLGRRACAVNIRTWEEYVKVRDTLLEDAKNGTCPWPRIVFDTVDAFMELLDRHLTAEQNARRRAGELRSMVEFGQSGAGYRVLRTELAKEIKRFEAAGFYWTLCCQMKKERNVVNVGDGQQVIETKRSVLFGTAMDLLKAYADMVAHIYLDKVMVPIYTESKLPSGRSYKRQTGERTVFVHYLDVVPESGLGDQKRRILGFDTSLRLPPVDGWAHFARFYDSKIEEYQRNPDAAIGRFMENLKLVEQAESP